MRRVAVILATCLAWPAGADCVLPEPTPAATAWQVVEGEEFAFTATSPAYPGLSVDLATDAPVIPEVLDFVTLPRYGARVGLLQYFSGDPGTSVLVTMVRNAIIDLGTGETLATPVYSLDCVGIPWTWYDDHVEIAEVDGIERIPLPGR